MELSPIGIIVILIVVAVIGFGGVYLVTEIPLRIIRMMNKEEEKYRRQLKQKELRQKKIMEEGTEAEKQQLIYEELQEIKQSQSSLRALFFIDWFFK